MGTPTDVRSIPRILFDEFSTEHGGEGAQEFLLREGGKEIYIRPLHTCGMALAFRDFVASHQQNGAYIKLLSRIPKNDLDLEDRHPVKGIRILGMIQAEHGPTSAHLSFKPGITSIDLLQPHSKLLLDMITRAQKLATPFQHILTREFAQA